MPWRYESAHFHDSRLTKFQVSGIEGNFRNTAQISMRVLRDNKDSLMAVLEAFVYDPLISWRLTAGQEAHAGGE